MSTVLSEYMMMFICTVGYTMDTMYFEPLPNVIDIAPDLQMPQFSLVNSKHSDCSTNYTSGNTYVSQCCCIAYFSVAARGFLPPGANVCVAAPSSQGCGERVPSS